MKTPALETPASFDGASTEMLPNDKRGESTQPSQHLHSSPTSTHDHSFMMAPPHRENNTNKCLLLNLPDELVMEIAAILCAPDEKGERVLPGYQIIFEGFEPGSQADYRATLRDCQYSASGLWPAQGNHRLLGPDQASLMAGLAASSTISLLQGPSAWAVLGMENCFIS